jgi:hypothetical protein
MLLQMPCKVCLQKGGIEDIVISIEMMKQGCDWGSKKLCRHQVDCLVHDTSWSYNRIGEGTGRVVELCTEV